MKAYEIISEAPTPQALTGRANSLAGGHPAGPFRSLFAGSRHTQRAFAKIDARRKRLNIASGKWSTKWQARLGPWVWLLKLLGILTACYQLWDDFGEAEQMYMDGEFSEDEYKTFRQFAQGVFITQIVAPAIARAIVNTKIVTGIARLITRVIGLGTGVVTAGGSLAALVATEAFFTWFVWFLGTKQAQDWLAEHVAGALIFTGSIPDTAWDMLTGFYEKKDQKRVATGKPSGKTPGSSTEPMPGATGLSKVVPTGTPLTVNGVRVTDANGYLDPYAMTDLDVKAALANPQTGPALAQKLAALPKRPLDNTSKSAMGANP